MEHPPCPRSTNTLIRSQPTLQPPIHRNSSSFRHYSRNQPCNCRRKGPPRHNLSVSGFLANCPLPREDYYNRFPIQFQKNKPALLRSDVPSLGSPGSPLDMLIYVLTGKEHDCQGVSWKRLFRS